MKPLGRDFLLQGTYDIGLPVIHGIEKLVQGEFRKKYRSIHLNPFPPTVHQSVRKLQGWDQGIPDITSVTTRHNSHTRQTFLLAPCISGSNYSVIFTNYTDCVPPISDCLHQASCTLNRSTDTNVTHTNVTDPDVPDVGKKCICTHGFTGDRCESNIIETIKTDVDAAVLVEDNFRYVSNQTKSLALALQDQINQTYEELYMSVLIIPEIMTKLFTFAEIVADRNDDIGKVADWYVYLTSEVHWQCLILDCELLNVTAPQCINKSTESRNAILNSESASFNMLKLMLLKHKDTYKDSYTYRNLAVAVAKNKGDKLPTVIQAQYGKFEMPYWETFQEMIKNKVTSVVVLTYQSSPYIFANNTEAINTGIVKMNIVNDKRKDLTLPDPKDPVGLRVSAESALTAEKWKPMEPSKTQDGAFTAILAFNYSITGFIVDINFESKKTCRTLGKFGPQAFPSEDDFDILVETKGSSRVKQHRPDILIFYFADQTLQIAHTYTEEGEALKKPLLMVVQCKDDSLTCRKRSPSPATLPPGILNPHRYRIVGVDLRTFDDETSTWMVNDSIQLLSGSRTNVAYKSNFFGTFSAEVIVVAPDTIDFSSIFLNFWEKLQETPHAMACILSIWIIAIIINIPLRRLDKRDAILWSYLPLEDNPPGAIYKYYISVSTAMRSSKRLSSKVYLKVIGDKGDSGTRQLADGNRQNFINGTTSHFVMKTTDEIGHLKNLVVWHDNVGPSPNWLLSKIVIGDIKNNRRYVFVCGKWLSLGGEDGRTWKNLPTLDDQLMDSQMIMNEVSKRNMFDDHLWFSLFKRPNYSRFTRVQRLWSTTALLFLSMVTSAMFYNTPSDGGRVLSVGPLKLSYKQFSVGFMSAVIAVIPSMIIINVFKNRRFRGEEIPKICENSASTDQTKKKEKKKRRCCCGVCKYCTGTSMLPWWTIFFAYLLIICCICSASSFTFLFSLDWGTDLTVEWILAFSLGTAESIFIFEPVKALTLAVLLACCCSMNARRTLADLPLPTSTEKDEDAFDVEKYIQIRHTVRCPLDIYDDDSIETKRLKRRLQLDRKLVTLLKQWIVQLIYVILVALICSMNVITDTYYQNVHLKAMLYSKQPNSTDDIWNWTINTFVQKIYPKRYVNDDIRLSYALRFTDDVYHYRLGPVRIRQVRVEVNESCIPLEPMSDVVSRCPLEYKSLTEATQNYCPGWAQHDLCCFDENEETDYAFLYNNEDKTEALSYYGTFGLYGGGGYYVDLDRKQSIALSYLVKLRNQNWIDGETRAIFMEIMLYNANSKLFSHVKIVYELTHFGGIDMQYKITTTNLYPYQTAFDYIILGFQVIFVLIIFVKLVLIVFYTVRSRCSYFLTVECWISMLEVALGICAIVFFIIRVDHTITAVEKIFKNLGSFVSFEMVNEMDIWYRACISGVCFLTCLDLLKPLSFNFYLHLMRSTIIIARHKIFWFIIIFLIFIVAFASLIYLIYGHVEHEFSSMSTSILSLLRVSIGMISFRKNVKTEDMGLALIFVIFALAVTIITTDLFISMLNMAFADATDLIAKPGEYKFDKKLNRHLWGKFISIANVFKRSTVQPKTNGTDKDADPVDTKVGRIQQTMVGFLREDFYSQAQFMKVCLIWAKTLIDNKLKELRCISRLFKEGSQYIYMDKSSKFVLMLVYKQSLEEEEIPARFMCKSQIEGKSGPPPDTFVELLSDMFLFTVPDALLEKGPVDIKVVDRYGREDNNKSNDMYIIASFDKGVTWQRYLSLSSNPDNPYFRVTLKSCPTHAIAARCDPWMTNSQVVRGTLESHVISCSGGRVILSSDKRVIVVIEENSVKSACKFSFMFEEKKPVSIVYILVSDDVKKPIKMTLPQTEYLPSLEGKTVKPREFYSLTCDGIQEWKKGISPVERNMLGHFVFRVENLRRSVLKRVTLAPESESD